ncbi:hypothetical protein [Falsiroseomonas tokyonensis]|uniref:VIT family protein n=1 Tax=Falsiroseomonas tokyonensis TaxID=430521 RepID=A0ABV7BQ17_9PROT|nr:hypothetical protein [Falsiroseomonas tokyonensis]MBU8537687.1 hypothetical protein [Falsiroseomonas tokyonensis]
MSGSVDPASAAEVLRQAQTLILGQIDASKSLDLKAMAVLQASQAMAVAGLGGAALGLSGQDWLPWRGAVDLLATGGMAAIAALIAGWSLRGSEIAAPALRPSTLLDREAQKLPPAQLCLFLAYELDRAIERNNLAAQSAARRFGAALYAAILAPLFGVLAAATLAIPQWRSFIGMALGCLAALLLLRQMIRLFGTSSR